MIGFFSAFYHKFKCQFMAKLCIFVKKWRKKILSKFLKYTISDVYLPKNLIPDAQYSLNVNLPCLAVILHFRLFLAPENEFLSKNTSEVVCFKKFERILFCHFLAKMHIFAINRHLKEVEN